MAQVFEDILRGQIPALLERCFVLNIVRSMAFSDNLEGYPKTKCQVFFTSDY